MPANSLPQTAEEVRAIQTYRVTGPYFDGRVATLSDRQKAALAELLAAFWGEAPRAQVTVTMQQPNRRTGCSVNNPVCWTRVNNPDDCSCNEYSSDNRTKIVIRNHKLKGE